MSIRSFSTSIVATARAYKSVVNRQLRQFPKLEEGDLKPRSVRIPKEMPKYPEYPYGSAQIFKRSDSGLYGGQVTGFGNQVSEMRNKSRRTWIPNAIHKQLWSEALNRMIKIRLTTRVLRTITKEGGLDRYLTKDSSARVKELGLFGWRLRYDVLKAQEAQARGPNYKVSQLPTGDSVKCYYEGQYRGQPIQLTVGRRRLIQLMFDTVKFNTPGELKFSQFSTARASTSFEELLKECEKYEIDLTAASV